MIFPAEWDLPSDGGESAGSIPAGYDSYKLATPPEFPRQRSAWMDRMPVGSCGRAVGSHCTLPEGHHHVGLLCNSLRSQP